MKVIEKDFGKGRFIGGATIYPYQITFGISLRYWPDLYMPNIRIHFLCFKVWLGVRLKHK